jgi:AraC-like DNA-binding protein
MLAKQLAFQVSYGNVADLKRYVRETGCKPEKFVVHLNINPTDLRTAMSKREATYHNRSETLHADTCESVCRGMEAGEVRLEAFSRRQYPGRRLPRGVLPGLSTVGFWDARQQQHWGTGWHYNEGLELSLLESGPLTFSVRGRQYELRSGTATLTRPWLEHSLGNPCVSAARAYWLIVDLGVRSAGQPWRWPSWVVLSPDDRRALADAVERTAVHTWQASSDLRRCFQRLGSVVQQADAASQASLLAVLVNEALVLLLDALRRPRVSRDPSPLDACQRVEQFWRALGQDAIRLSEEWTVQGLAEACGLGVTQFISYTHQITNLSPLRYFRQCQLETAARRLLDAPTQSITQIALSSGFGSGAYFAKLFREHFGCTPNVYRLVNRRR